MDRQPLDDAERALYETASGDDLDAKAKWLADATRAMLEAGALTAAERGVALAQMEARREALLGEGKAAPAARVEANRARLEGKAPAKPPPVEFDAAIRALHAQIAPLAVLERETKRGGMLSLADATKLGEKGDLEGRVASLEDKCAGWYETRAELEARLGPLRASLASLALKKLNAASSAPAGGGGWATVSKGKRR